MIIGSTLSRINSVIISARTVCFHRWFVQCDGWGLGLRGVLGLWGCLSGSRYPRIMRDHVSMSMNHVART